MLRDCLVVGIRNLALSEKLQNMDPKLTLELAKTMGRQKSAVKDQQCQLQLTRKHRSLTHQLFDHKALPLSRPKPEGLSEAQTSQISKGKTGV